MSTLNKKRVEVFFDGDCPICIKEIRLLRWCDRKQRIEFTDIAAAEFDPEKFGFTQKHFMDEIRGRLPDGTWIKGVEVFRELYGAIGLGFLIPLSRIPGISHGLDAGYRVFARNRLWLTGKCDENCVVPQDGVKPNGEPAPQPHES